MSICSSIFPILSCCSLKASGLILWSLIYCELLFVQSERRRSSFSFLHTIIQVFPETFVKAAVFSSTCFGYLCEKSGGCCWVLFCSIDLYVCFCANTTLFSLLWLCSIGWSRVLRYLHCCCFLLRITLAIHTLLCFQMNIRVGFSMSMWNVIGILMWIALNL
jgi:hypothetical protein